jgi:hypothetical protein
MSAITLANGTTIAPINPALDKFVTNVLTHGVSYLETIRDLDAPVKRTRGRKPETAAQKTERNYYENDGPRPRRADRDAHMATLAPSKGQMRRINRKYEDAGLRTFESMDDFKSVFPTMLDASLEYASLS